MRHSVPRGLLHLVMAAAVMQLSTGRVIAEDPEPPLPQSMETSGFDVSMPAAPAAADAVLLDKLTLGQGAGPSQDFVGNSPSDSQAADDFCVPPSTGFWDITQVDVRGGYSDPSYVVNEARVHFYNHDGSGEPGTEVYSALLTAGNAASGNLQIGLTPPARLVGFDCFWVSVRAIQPPNPSNASFAWLWADRELGQEDMIPSIYRLPFDTTSPCFATWRARVAICNRGLDPDLAFMLSGVANSSHLTPTITTLWPPGGLNEEVILTVTGEKFAVGATISWTVGLSVTQFSPTISGADILTVAIPAAFVGPVGQTAFVQVSNPAPCVGVCYSNVVSFYLVDPSFTYLPLVRR